MNSRFLDRLHHPSRPVIVFDGAMGTNLQVQNLTAEDFGGKEYEGCNEYLVHTKPEAVANVHRGFLEAGADVIETDTFGGASIVLAEYDLADKAYYLNKTAAELAKGIAAEFSTPEKPRFVAGSIGPGTKLPTLGHIDFDTLTVAFAEQAEGLYDGGVDLFIVETCQDVLQIKAALNAIEEVFKKKGARIPLMVSVTMEATGTMLVGSDISAALAILQPYPIDILGLNCATGPDRMAEHVKYLSEHSPFVVSCVPNAGLPENIGGHAHYKLTPIELKMALMRFVEDLGVQVIGGCCGTRYDHIRELSEIGKTLKPKIRKFTWEPSAASIYTAQPYEQENSFLIVGERLNASGSKKCRDLLNAEDWDGLVAMAREQVREGAHVLDVNVDYVGRDGVRDMKELVSRIVTNATLPLMLDSTEWEKMEAGLKVAGGKCLLNSTNYEDGEPRFYQVLELAKKYGAGIVIGTIDEDGMARTADKKFAIAQRAYNAAVACGIPPEEIFFDTLALPISTGIEEDRKNGKATIEAIRRIRQELPGCHVILGISNISFGLNPAARQVLNSMFLHEAMQAGMDSAIVSANKILPLAKIDPQHQEICRKLIYDKREFDGDICVYDPLGDLTTVFAGKTTKRDRTEDANLPVEERLKRHIIDGERIGLDIQLAKALETYPPLEIINTFLLDGMKVVGELFGSGQMQLPFVLQSAETMKAAVAYLEPYMEKSESGDNAKGTFIIATVKGDVHDIGKNLVDIILSNNGYRVINLGIKQSVDNIIEAYEKHQADCIAMSGLLVKSTAFMKENLEVFNQKGITVPVILGGAALTPKFVHEDCQNTYKGKVVYGKDAFSDLHFMDKLMPAKSAGKWDDLQGILDEIGQDNGAVKEAKASPETSVEEAKEADTPVVIDTRRSEAVAADIDRPNPPFWGTKLLQPEDIPFEEIFWHLDLQALVAGQWQFRKPKDQSREEYDAFLAETVYPILEEWKHKIITEKLLHPQVIYGYFPCQAEGNSLYLYDPEVMARGQTIINGGQTIINGGQTIINGGQDARPTKESGTGILPVTGPTKESGTGILPVTGPTKESGTGILPVTGPTKESGTGILPVTATKESGTGILPVTATKESGTGILPVTATKESGTGILPVTATPAATFTFPRQKSGRRLCIADFFAPKESGKIDVFPMQVATVGEIATEYAQQLFANNQYSDYLYFHGLAVQTAEAVAEWTHARIRRELGFASEEPDNIRDMLAQRYRGSRYSFGYPACPNMADQYKQLELLKCDRINLYMDESEQLYPEQSTTAIITYHPAAKYFTA